VAGSITNGEKQLFFHHPAMGEMKRWFQIIRKGSIYKRTGSLQETFLKITCFKVFFAPVRQRFCAIFIHAWGWTFFNTDQFGVDQHSVKYDLLGNPWALESRGR